MQFNADVVEEIRRGHNHVERVRGFVRQIIREEIGHGARDQIEKWVREVIRDELSKGTETNVSN